MDTAVINIRVDPLVKTQAQTIAEELGFSLSSIIDAFLRQFTRTRSVSFSLSEEPSDYLKEVLAEAREDIKAGRVSPGFSDAATAVKWLENKSRRYANHR